MKTGDLVVRKWFGEQEISMIGIIVDLGRNGSYEVIWWNHGIPSLDTLYGWRQEEWEVINGSW